MIRINLLPQKRRQAAASGEIWAVATIVAIALEVVGCLVLYGFKKDDLDQAHHRNNALQKQITELSQVAKDHEEVKGKLKRLKEREDAIDKLQAARTGPTAMLLEIARILTPGRGPTVDPEYLAKLRRESPTQDFNPKWDTRRLWLVKFLESDRKVQLQGLARDGEDVSELARRMNLSQYFDEVVLLPAKRTQTTNGLAMVSFKLEAQVKY